MTTGMVRESLKRWYSESGFDVIGDVASAEEADPTRYCPPTTARGDRHRYAWHGRH